MESDRGQTRVLSPAKINLFLQVLGKRTDGYHEVRTLMCGIGLYDIVSLGFNAGRISVACRHPLVPEDETNLAHRAASLFFSTLNVNRGVAVAIEKHIPVAAGLGGGSSNAAAVLTALNRYYHYPLDPENLVSMGRCLGADVPFFIFGKPAMATGIGEQLERFDGLAPFSVVIIFPGIPVSTASIFSRLNLKLTNPVKEDNKYFFKNEPFDPERHLRNDLETVAGSTCPDILTAKQALLSVGARGALMSGSGSAVFGLFTGKDQAARAYRSLSHNAKWTLFMADLLV
ncbi:MAG: 4-(cytidine 5'-diphospho)-2-C-methyl-D-erythritol kinase [Desulfobacterales bacterium]|nr:4-(cytidine 5'-diphospho)-2-C-methyl-D-erythritol kinase [Desulfobacterales bacterium]